MSHENMEIRNEAVRRFIAAFEGDDDSFRHTLHPEIEWYPIEENRTPTRGVKAAMWNRNQWLDTWDEHRLDVEEVIENRDSVVAPYPSSRGRPVESKSTSLLRADEGAGGQDRLHLRPRGQERGARSRRA